MTKQTSDEQPKTIYLENRDDGGDGKQWCAIKIWSDENCTQYVRVDLVMDLIKNQPVMSDFPMSQETSNALIAKLEGVLR